MDISRFKNDKEIVEFLKSEIEKIVLLNECRLYKEEQFQISEEVIKYRNSIEWIIRCNQIIKNIKYALKKCLKYAEAMVWPLEETDNKKLYAYYLEDSVYRDLVLWDILRQLLNEFYECGYSEKDDISVYKFLKRNKRKIGIAKANRILYYLNSNKHKQVRETLRNSFTHYVERTSSYVLHRQINGKTRPQTDYLLPRHPFENLNYVISDVRKLINILNEFVREIQEYGNNRIALFEVTCYMPCGKEVIDTEHWNLKILSERYEQIIIPCKKYCEKANKYKENYVCRPMKICYRRIYSKQDKQEGTFIPKLSFQDVATKFEKDSEVKEQGEAETP